jgi:hypothetical protein
VKTTGSIHQPIASEMIRIKPMNSLAGCEVLVGTLLLFRKPGTDGKHSCKIKGEDDPLRNDKSCFRHGLSSFGTLMVTIVMPDREPRKSQGHDLQPLCSNDCPMP